MARARPTAAARAASPTKLAHRLAAVLRRRIAEGDLNHGDQLPAEADLLREFKVSRPTLREALRVIESEGLIELGRGARFGAKVSGPSIDVAARYGGLYLAVQRATLGEVHQVRTLLEPSLVRMLAHNPSRAHLRVLRECVEVERLALQLDDLATTVSALNAFHRQLVRLSHNHALSLLAGILEGFPAKAYAQLLESGTRAAINAFRERTARSVRAHAELVELIAAGEEAKAENFWRQYQLDTADYLERAGLAKLRVGLPDAED